MQLARVLAEEGMTLTAAARLLGVANATVVRRYVTGARLPARPVMRRIVQVFDGRVTANDFYGLEGLIAECQARRCQRAAEERHRDEPPLPLSLPEREPR